MQFDVAKCTTLFGHSKSFGNLIGLFIFSLTYTDNSLNLILKVPVKMIEEAEKLSPTSLTRQIQKELMSVQTRPLYRIFKWMSSYLVTSRLKVQTKQEVHTEPHFC